MSQTLVGRRERFGKVEKQSVEAAASAVAVEAMGAAGAIVLAVIGIAGGSPPTLMAIATIVLGGAMLMDAGAMGARYERLVRSSSRLERAVAGVQVGGGILAGALAGVAGIALGVLSLLHLPPVPLCAAALIVFGVALLTGSAATDRVASVPTPRWGDVSLRVAAFFQLLLGIGAVVLAIIALFRQYPVTLVLVGFLGVGTAVLLSAFALAMQLWLSAPSPWSRR